MPRIFFTLLIIFCVTIAVDARTPGGGDSPDITSNAGIVAHETSSIILALLDTDGELRLPGGEIIRQPVSLRMDAPAGVREQVTSRLMSEGIRLAAESSRYHILQVEWEPENRLVRERGGASKRIMQSVVIFSWYDEDREIQKTWTSSFNREDEIPSDRVSEIESSWDPALFQEREESRRFSFIRRLAEPAVITGAVAVTVYLLYNVRR